MYEVVRTYDFFLEHRLILEFFWSTNFVGEILRSCVADRSTSIVDFRGVVACHTCVGFADSATPKTYADSRALSRWVDAFASKINC